MGCSSIAALGKADPLMSNLTFYIDPWTWPRALTLILKQGKSDVQTQFLAFYHDLWPTTLTYIPNLAKGKVNLPDIKVIGQMVQAWEHWQTGRRMDATKYIISLLR